MLGYTVHNNVKVTGRFTCTDHTDEKRRKYAGLCRYSLREAATLLYLLVYIEKHLLLLFVFTLRLQYLKRLYKTYTRCKHCRKLSAEERQILRLELIFDICRLVLCRIFIGCTEQAFLSELINKFNGIFRHFGAFYLFTVNVGSNVSKSCHWLSPIHHNRINNLHIKWKLLYNKIIP